MHRIPGPAQIAVWSLAFLMVRVCLSTISRAKSREQRTVAGAVFGVGHGPLGLHGCLVGKLIPLQNVVNS